MEKMSNSFFELCEDGDKPKADDEGTREKLTTTTRECEFCGKKFSSGKALGGHKRSHLQAQRKEKEANNSKGIIKLSPSNLMSNDKFSCSICRKDFPSNKSLYGHMRSHSDRNWKGIHPPPNSKQSSHSDSSMEENKGYFNADEESAIDLAKHSQMQPRWHKTTIRDEELVYSEEENIAAQILVSLRHDTWPCGEYPELPQVELCVKNMEGASNGMIIEDIPSTSGLKDHVSHFTATKVLKNNSNKKKRKMIVKLKNPYFLEFKDEKLDGYQCDI